MLTCKFGNWWEENPQRGRANNSAVIIRHKIDEEDFTKIIKHCEDDQRFTWEYYMDYYQSHISWIHMRVIFGFEVLVDNVCDPDLDYLEFKPEIKKLFDQE